MCRNGGGRRSALGDGKIRDPRALRFIAAMEEGAEAPSEE